MRREWVTVEGIFRQNNRDQVHKLRLAVDDGVVRGRVEGFVALKLGYDRIAIKLEWDDDEYYDNINQCLIGTSEMAWERFRDGAFFSEAGNRTEANVVCVYDRRLQRICLAIRPTVVALLSNT